MYTPKIENGDVALNQSGESTNLTNTAAAKQVVIIAFLMWQGEWFLEPDHGIRWLDIRGKGRTTQEVLQIVQSGLLKNPYIEKIIDISIRFANDSDKIQNKATLNYTVIMNSERISGAIAA